MRMAVLALGLIFCLFPYTQILKIGSYTQPYAFVFCGLGALMSLSQLQKNFPRDQALVVFLFAMLGLTIFMVTCLPSPTPQDFKSLLIYLSPGIFCFSGFAIASENPKLADRIIVAAAVIWLAVGVIQTVVSPTFATQFVGEWEESATIVVESGRGVLGLAPEPTHFGFHLIILAATLMIVRKRLYLSIACLAAAVLLARSSSAILVIALGSIAYIAFYTRRARVFLIGVVPAYFAMGAIVESGLLPESLRIVGILRTIYEDPMLLITSDNSVNARLGGIYVGVNKVLSNAFIPYGMSSRSWVESIGLSLSQYPWLYDISDAGIPSGLVIVVYQTGVFGLILLFLMLRRVMARHHSKYQSWLLCMMLFVFLSQYMISTPGFGLIYGLMLARVWRAGKANPGMPLQRLLPAPDWRDRGQVFSGRVPVRRGMNEVG